MKREWRICHLQNLAEAYESEIKSRAPKTLKSCTRILKLYARERRRVDNQYKPKRWRRKQKTRSLKQEVQNIISRNHKIRINQVKKNEESDFEESDFETDEDDDDQNNDQRDDRSDDQNDNQSDDDKSDQMQEHIKTAMPNNGRSEATQDQNEYQHNEADHSREADDYFNLYLQRTPSEDNDSEQRMLEAHIMSQSLENRYMDFVNTGVMEYV